MSFYIAGTGSALPEKIVSNEDLTAFLDTSDEWIFTRTGIHNLPRAHARNAQRPCDLSARRALEDAGLSRGRRSGSSSARPCAGIRSPLRSRASWRKRSVRARPRSTWNAACVGVLYCMEIADSFIATGKADTVLIVSAEAMSKLLGLERPFHLRALRRRGPARSCSERARAGWRGCCPPIPIRMSIRHAQHRGHEHARTTTRARTARHAHGRRRGL